LLRRSAFRVIAGGLGEGGGKDPEFREQLLPPERRDGAAAEAGDRSPHPDEGEGRRRGNGPVRNAGGGDHPEADSIVNALGRLPLQEEAAAFGLAAPVFYPIGDCLAAKNVYEANRLGFNVAMDIGKSM